MYILGDPNPNLLGSKISESTFIVVRPPMICVKTLLAIWILYWSQVCWIAYEETSLLFVDSLKMKVPLEISQLLICPLVKIVWSMAKVESVWLPSGKQQSQFCKLYWTTSQPKGFGLVSSMPFRFPFHLPVLFYDEHFS